MVSFLGRGYRHRLSSKLRFINAITGLAFLLLCAGIAAAFIAIKNESIDVMQQDMGRVVANSDLTRAVSELFSDIHLLSDTFYRSSHLDSEGTRLSAVLDGISQGVRDPQLETRLTELAGQFQSFLAQCARVNDLLHAEDDVFGNVERELTDLENLISKLLVDATLKGEDTSFVTQQLTLAIGFRESLLSIAKLNAELDLGTRTSTSTDRDAPILAAIDDLALRLQTISASAPEVAHHGRLIEGGIQDLRKSVSGFFVEIEKLMERYGRWMPRNRMCFRISNR